MQLLNTRTVRTMMKSGYLQTIYVAITAICFIIADARVWLEAPSVGNCRGDTVLNCHYCDTPSTKRTWSRKIGHVWEVIMENGTQIGPLHRLIIKEEINGWFSLVISGADNMAAGLYRCGVGQFQSEGIELRVECKPEKAEVRLTQNKFIEIRMNTVFPVPQLNFTLTDGAMKDTALTFQYPKCSGHSWIQDCVWTSVTAMSNDGHHSYMLRATTMSETVFTGIIY